MPWYTNKETGGKFNTDWLDAEYKQRYAQIHFNQETANNLNKQEEENDFIKEVNSYLGNPEVNQSLKKDVDAQIRILECVQENKINPNYGGGPEYSRNCALCTAAIVLQAKGYDVEAQPRSTTFRGVENLFKPDYSNPDNYMLSNAATKLTGIPVPHATWDREANKATYYLNYKKPGDTIMIRVDNPPITPKGANAVAKAVIDKVHKWGPGSVGELSVLWKSRGSAHSVSILNLRGRATIYDGQTNSMYDEDQFVLYFKQTTANTTTLIRLDNADWMIDSPQFMNDLKKMVKRRDVK